MLEYSNMSNYSSFSLGNIKEIKKSNIIYINLQYIYINRHYSDLRLYMSVSVR